LQKQFQLLHSQFTLRSDQDTLRNEINFASQDASHGMRIRAKETISITTRNNCYGIGNQNQVFQVAKKPWELAYALIGLVHRRALAEFGDCLRLHAACADYRGSRFIVIGEKGVGKTTLMLHLLLGQKSFKVSGDELVIVRGDQAMPFPRRFHVKSGTFELLSGYQAQIRKSPGFRIAPSSWLYAFSPAEAGFDWVIESKKVEAIFYISPNHKSPTRIEECAGLQMVKNIMPMSYYSESNEPFKIRELCRLVQNAKAYRIYLGKLDKVAKIIQNSFSIGTTAFKHQ
jgi:hypothetical protein